MRSALEALIGENTLLDPGPGILVSSSLSTAKFFFYQSPLLWPSTPSQSRRADGARLFCAGGIAAIQFEFHLSRFNVVEWNLFEWPSHAGRPKLTRQAHSDALHNKSNT